MKKTEFWVKKISEEGQKTGLGEDILKLQLHKLNAVLCSLLINMNRDDGDGYEVSSIHNMISIVR